MGCVDELCAGLADLARPRRQPPGYCPGFLPRGLSTRCLCGSARGRLEYSSTARQLSSGHVGPMKKKTTLRRPKKNEKMENRNTSSGKNTSLIWVPTIAEVQSFPTENYHTTRNAPDQPANTLPSAVAWNRLISASECSNWPSPLWRFLSAACAQRAAPTPSPRLTPRRGDSEPQSLSAGERPADQQTAGRVPSS